VPYRRHKLSWFILEGLNAFAATYFFYYLFFHLRDRYGFGNAQNLAVCAGHGFVYMFASVYGGRYAQRAGYLTSLLLGFGLMGGALVLGALSASLAGLVVAVPLWTLGMCFTWPALEALVSEEESSLRLQRMVGVYNLVWSGGAAIAYFVGGALKEALGDTSIFWLPALLHGVQALCVLRLRRRVTLPSGTVAEPEQQPAAADPPRARPGLPGRAFLLLAWLANVFAYVAQNAAIPVFPNLAERLHLTTSEAGFFCSTWLFARLGTFVGLWLWTGWHYRFRWLFSGFVVMTGCFLAMLLGHHVALIVLAQAGFGCGIGIMYYSSLFYSMDTSETKGTHGGLHEAVIGGGIFGGAAIGSAGQYLFGSHTSSTWAVSVALVLGFVALLVVWLRFRRKP
jgi:MFS family permease